MCGIAGFLDEHASEQRARKVAGALPHRGPDDSGVWCDPHAGVGLGHTRLAILDVSCAGHQPMMSASGRYVFIFNGEIYNHLALRAELGQNSPEWRGHSDTETLLAAFEAWGIEQTIQRAVGMFAFALWDRRDRVLSLGRDRLGEKPLFYGWQGDAFLFGSELKALRRHPAFRGEIDRDALSSFMRYGYVPSPHSIYRDIHKLTPGTLLCVHPARCASPAAVPYWSLVDVARRGLQTPFAGSDVEAINDLEAKLSTAVALQQIADVPLGAFLSGGIDSSTIAALMQTQSSRPIHTFTIGFGDPKYNEATHARGVANHLGTDHTELYVTSDEARAVIPKLPVLYDEPFADSSQIPTFLVSQLARRHVTVSLSGDAGDELFGGYNRYAWTHTLLRTPTVIRQIASAGLTALSPNQWDRLYVRMCPMLPRSLRMGHAGDQAHKLASVLKLTSSAAVYQHLISTWPDPDQLVLGGHSSRDSVSLWEDLSDFRSPEHRMMAIDALTYLPDDILCKVDRAAMGVSLETRVPFLDHRVVEYAWQLPLHMKIRNGQGKWLLRQLLYKYVPRELIDRPKMGFGVPIGAWLRGPLRDWAETLLNESKLNAEGYLNPAPVRQIWAEHLSGTRNWQYRLWNVLMFECWLAESR